MIPHRIRSERERHARPTCRPTTVVAWHGDGALQHGDGMAMAQRGRVSVRRPRRFVHDAAATAYLAISPTHQSPICKLISHLTSERLPLSSARDESSRHVAPRPPFHRCMLLTALSARRYRGRCCCALDTAGVGITCICFIALLADQ